jgi:HK97 family phage major capsid protein
LLGFPAYSNADMSVARTQGSASNCADVYFGKWSSLIIGDLLGINISASEHVNFTSDQIVLRMIKRTGILVGVPADFTVAVGAKIA